jgi:hypothetical protein
MATLIACANTNFTTLTTWQIVDSTSYLNSTAAASDLTTSYARSTAFTPGAIVIDGIALHIYSRKGTTGTMSVSLAGNTSGTADAAVTSTNTTLRDTRLALASTDWVGGVITCNGKTMTVTSISGTDTFVGASWSGGGNPGDGNAWSLADGVLPGTLVVVNTADFPAGTNGQFWFHFFKFASPVTLVDATAYKVQGKTSTTAMITLYRDATASNWSRMLRTTSNPGSLAAGDNFLIAEEKTGAGAATSRTVTMNNTDTTAFGFVMVTDGGTLTYGNSAATNYNLRLAGDMKVTDGGTLYIGTPSGGEIPRDSTAKLEFDCGSDNQYGLVINALATFKAQGLSRTTGKNIVMCKLNTDEAIGQTVLGVGTDTGWLDGDNIVIASTTRTMAQCEKRVLDVDASSTELTVTAALTYAHSGTSPTDAEVGLLTRNVKIGAVTAGFVASISLAGTTIDLDWVEFYEIENFNLGNVWDGTTRDVDYCSIYNTEGAGLYIGSITDSSVVTIKNNIFYNFNTDASAYTTYAMTFYFPADANGTIYFENNMVCYGKTGTYDSSYSGIVINVASNTGVSTSTFKNNYISSIYNSSAIPTIRFTPSSAWESCRMTADITGNSIHSNQAVGMWFSIALENSVIGGSTFWRNARSGLVIDGDGTLGFIGNSIIKDSVFFGNTSNLVIGTTNAADLIIQNITASGDSSFASTAGVLFDDYATQSYPISCKVYIVGCDFGTASGIKVAHTTADVNFATTVAKLAQYEIHILNSTLASGTRITGFPSSTAHRVTSYVREQFCDAVAPTSYYYYGTVTSQTTIRDGDSGSAWKMTPNNATFKLILPGASVMDTFKAAVSADSAVTVTARVYKDASYNGNAPRLVLVGGIVPGIDADVTDSLSVAAETWETLSVSDTPDEDCCIEFYIDCDGTAGNVYVDNITVSQ